MYIRKILKEVNIILDKALEKFHLSDLTRAFVKLLFIPFPFALIATFIPCVFIGWLIAITGGIFGAAVVGYSIFYND